MTTDTTQPTNPETPDSNLKRIALLLKHFFDQGAKFHDYCKMLEQEDLQHALHTFLRMYNMVGTSCLELFKQVQAGNEEAVEPMISVIEDLNDFVTLRQLFDEALTQRFSEPVSEASGTHTYT